MPRVDGTSRDLLDMIGRMRGRPLARLPRPADVTEYKAGSSQEQRSARFGFVAENLLTFLLII